MFANYIDGEWVASHEATTNRNPGDLADVIGEYARASSDDVERAVAAASAAFPAWRDSSPELRADVLAAASQEILARSHELGTLLAREEGKTRAEGIAEAVRAGRIFGYFAGEALRAGGEWLPSVRPGVEVEIRREPEGVVGVITPWNFPIAIPAWKIAPALAYGNCVVFKPAELVPGSAWMLADILVRAGVPRGVFNLVMGSGRTVGRALVDAPHVRAVTFTGSVATGRAVGIDCMASGKKVQLEMGGKNPLVIDADADLDTAVAVAINSAFFSTGQRCTAASRLIVEDAIHDAFVERMVDAMAKLQVGDALAEATDIGPVASEAQLASDLDYIALGRSEGAELVCGGQRLERGSSGYYLEPALFVGADNAMRIAREEIFGPVAAVIRAADYEEALTIANDTAFGLSAGICTRSLRRASDFKRRSRAGMVMVNLPTAGVDYHVPFGGRGASSYGSREQGSYAREFYTAVKTTYTLP